MGRFWKMVAYASVGAIAGCAVCFWGLDLIEAHTWVGPSPPDQVHDTLMVGPFEADTVIDLLFLFPIIAALVAAAIGWGWPKPARGNPAAAAVLGLLAVTLYLYLYRLLGGYALSHLWDTFS